jgi:IS5 family transposase
MAFRIQGQKDAFDSIIAGVPANKTLEAIDEMIDWGAVRAILARGYDDSGKGWIGFDPIVLFKMLLLEQFYNLSDVQVSVEAGDRLSFRRFLALSAGEAAPDDTTLVKFRKRMRNSAGLLDAAHAEFNRQLAAKNLFVKPGAIKVVDATVIRAATRPPKVDKPAPGADEDNRPEEKTTPPEVQTQSRLDPDAAFGGKKGKTHLWLQNARSGGRGHGHDHGL